MNKFKVGDRVKIIKNAGWKDVKATVVKVFDETTLRLDLDEGSVYYHTNDLIPAIYMKNIAWNPNSLELIEPETPNWAIKRAAELSGLSNPDDIGHWRRVGTDSFRAFAKYISEHEKEPVDPVVLKAREICAKYYNHLNSQIFAGEYDDSDDVKAIIEALNTEVPKT